MLFQKQYLALIKDIQLKYEWNQKLINQQNQLICQNDNKFAQIDFSRHLQLIHQSTYFSNISDVFESYCVKLFDEIVEQTREAWKSGYTKLMQKYIPISEIALNISKNNVKNFKNFHNFLDLLKNANGYILLKIGPDNNYYQPPIQWTKEKIQILDRTRNPFNQPIDLAAEKYRKYMDTLTQQCKTLKEKFKSIKNNIINIENFGVISINGKNFTNDRLEFKHIFIIHQFGHFLEYLIRINAQNWDIARSYRSNIVHNEFISSNNQIQRINYFLDETQFKQLASSYIQQLKIIFKKSCKIKTDDQIKIFFQSLMQLCNIPIKYSNKNSALYIKNISLLFSFPDIKDFFFYNYKDSLTNGNARNKWSILKKWMWNEFMKH